MRELTSLGVGSRSDILSELPVWNGKALYRGRALGTSPAETMDSLKYIIVQIYLSRA
jgi:hypothetical protein